MKTWQNSVEVVNTNIAYGKVYGDGENLVEVDDGIYPTPVAVATAAVTEWEAGKMKFDWTDSDNDPSIVESYAIYIWSSELQEGQHFYMDNDGTHGPYSISSDIVLTPGSYDVTIEAESYGTGNGGGVSIQMDNAPITITAP